MPSATDPQIGLLLAALRAWFAAPAPHPRAEAADWDGFLGLAEETKTVGLLETGLERLAVAPPSRVRQALADARARTLRSNAAQLAETIASCELLTSRGVRNLAFKGVVSQLQLYGRLDLRSSQDIDLLVAGRDYGAAGKILVEAGFRAAVDPRNRWWHVYLGEAPYVPPPPSRFVIDLHYRLQQPGAPAPRDEQEFFTAAVDRKFGQRSIETLAPSFALLTNIVSYSKALRDREPWLVYAHAIAFAVSKMSCAERSEFEDLARRQGLARLAREAVGVSKRLFAISSGHEVDVRQADSELIQSALGRRSERLLRRSTMRWRWADGPLPWRIDQFARLTVNYYASTFVRRREESRTHR